MGNEEEEEEGENYFLLLLAAAGIEEGRIAHEGKVEEKEGRDSLVSFKLGIRQIKTGDGEFRNEMENLDYCSIE